MSIKAVFRFICAIFLLLRLRFEIASRLFALPMFISLQGYCL